MDKNILITRKELESLEGKPYEVDEAISFEPERFLNHSRLRDIKDAHITGTIVPLHGSTYFEFSWTLTATMVCPCAITNDDVDVPLSTSDEELISFDAVDDQQVLVLDNDVFDLELNFKSVDLKLAKDLELFEPYGAGNEEPVFISKNVKVNDIKKMQKNNKLHLRLELLQSDKKINAIIWNSSEEEVLKLLNSNYIDIIYKLKVNRYTNSEDARIYIESYKIF